MKLWKKVLAFMGVMLVVGCGISKETNTVKKFEELPTKIIVGLDDAFAPMGFKNEKGELVGFDIDLAKAVGEKLNIEIEFKAINWDSKILDLNSGSIDLIWSGLTITPERAEATEMSIPYYSSGQIIMVNSESDIKNKKDLEGKIVGVQSQSTGQEKVQKEGLDKIFKQLKTYAQYDQAFLDLDVQRIDAIVVGESYGKYIKSQKEKQAGEELYRILPEDYGKEDTGIAAKKGNKILIEAINNALNELKINGTYEKILNKWFGE